MNDTITEKTIDLDTVKDLGYHAVKRLFDIIVSLVGVILLLPVAAVVKVIYLFNKDFNSIFYYQERVGRNGKLFKLYKFRTMVPNADEILKKTLKINKKLAKEWKENQKFKDDPRITKVGKILRKSSLDELPQMINVFINDMSVIGPRPLVVGELDAHNGDHSIYESVKPGITGWWACNGRSATTYKKRLDLEYYYCNNASIGLDTKVFFKTIEVVIKRKGAK